MPLLETADITARFPAARGREDASLTGLATAVEARIVSYLGSDISGEDIEVFLEGGTRTLVLPRRLRANGSLTVYQQTPGGEVAVEPSLFRKIRGNQLRRIDSRWPYGDYRVVYQAEDLTDQAKDIGLRMVAGRLSDDGLSLHQDGGYRERREPESFEKREARLLGELPIVTLF